METWEIQHIVNGSNELINMGLLLGLMYHSSLCFSQGLIDKLNMSQFQCSLLDEWRDKSYIKVDATNLASPVLNVCSSTHDITRPM